MNKRKRTRRSHPDFRRIVQSWAAPQISENRAAKVCAAQAAHDKGLAELLQASLVGATPETAERIKRALVNLKARQAA